MTRDIRQSTGRERWVVLHYHIFKNAGCTVDAILQRHFGDDFVALHGDSDDARLCSDDVARLLRDDPDVRAITSHHLRYPKPVVPGVVFFDICFIRHPLARIRSLYYYGRRLDPASKLGALAQRHDERAFLECLVDTSPHILSDVQVHYLAHGGAFARPAGEDDCRRAEAIFRDASVAGVVELFDVCMTTAEYFLAPVFPGIDCASAPLNVSSPHAPAVAQTSDELSSMCRAAWGDRLCDEIERLNVWDMRLYHAARSEATRRFAMLPKGAARLADLQERNGHASTTMTADEQHIAA